MSVYLFFPVDPGAIAVLVYGTTSCASHVQKRTRQSTGRLPYAAVHAVRCRGLQPQCQSECTDKTLIPGKIPSSVPTRPCNDTYAPSMFSLCVRSFWFHLGCLLNLKDLSRQGNVFSLHCLCRVTTQSQSKMEAESAGLKQWLAIA